MIDELSSYQLNKEKCQVREENFYLALFYFIGNTILH